MLSLCFKYYFRLTIWTVELIKKITEIKVTDEEENERTITPTNISWMLVTGWMFYIGSMVLNVVYYKLHPSSPEMWTWGKKERLEEWTPQEDIYERQNNANLNTGVDIIY